MGEKRLMEYKTNQVWVSKKTQFCPSEAKSARLQALLSSPHGERNHARSAFHTVFSTPSLIPFEHLQSCLEKRMEKEEKPREENKGKSCLINK